MHVKPEKRPDNFASQDAFLANKMTQEGQAQLKAWSGQGSHPQQPYGKFTCSG